MLHLLTLNKNKRECENMKKLSTYLVVMFMIMYWIFRVVVVLMAQLGKDFVVQPLNMNFEIVLLFAFCYLQF